MTRPRARARGRRLAVALALATPLAAAERSARADKGKEDIEALLSEPVVSTSSKKATLESVAPATSTSISAEDLRRYGIHSLDEALNYLSLGFITQNPLHSVDVGARGVLFTSDFGNHVLLLVNGHAMNEQWDYTAYFERGAAIPFELIDHIEATLGPGSVLYGSSAMLGVINIITKRARDYEGVHLVVEGDIATSIRLAAGFGHEFKLFGRPAEVTYQLEYYTQSGPAFTFAPENAGIDPSTGRPKQFSGSPGDGIWGGTASRSYWTQIPAAYGRLIAGDFELTVHAATYKRGTPYTNQFNQTAGDFDAPHNYELDRWLQGDLKWHRALSRTVDASVRLYGDTYDFQQPLTTHTASSCLQGEADGCVIKVIGISRWVGLEPQVSVDWLADNRLVTNLGVDGRIVYAGEVGNAVDLATGYNPGSYGAFAELDKSIAVYGEQIWKPLSWLSLNGGARLDAQTRFGARVSPRAAAAVTPWEGGTLKAIYSEAFRAPSAYELYYTAPNVQIASRGLRPETVRSVEGTVEQRFGRHRILFGVFRTWWSDMVQLQSISDSALAAAIAAGQVATGTTSILQYQNVSTVDNYGFNLAFVGSSLADRLHYGLNFTGAYARRVDGSGNVTPLTVAPQVFGNARLAYDIGGPWPTAALAGQFYGGRPADRALDGGFTPTPYAPAQLDLRFTLSGDVPKVRGLRYRASADYAVSSKSAYVAGPVQAATPLQPNAQLAPVDQFRTTIGLQYDLKL